MGIKLIFHLKMLSDFHISGGFAWGKSVDAALLRDQRGFPTVRGSSLAGLFRSAARELEDYLPAGMIERVFGSAAQPKAWSFRSASAVNHVSLRSLNGKPFGGVRRGVCIDPVLRRAKDQKLFSREFGSTELSFRFIVEQVSPGIENKDEAALLVAAARMIRGLGSSVNRGAGRCVITLERVDGINEEISQQNLLDHFATMVRKKERVAFFKDSTSSVEKMPSNHAEGNWNSTKLLVIAENIEPLIISDGSLSGNEYETLSYIPGTILLGAFAQKFLSRSSNKDYDLFLALFRKGKIRFSPLYPAVRPKRGSIQLNPTIPMPQDMLTCKYRPFDQDSAHGAFLTGYAAEEQVPEGCVICGEDVPIQSVTGFISISSTGFPSLFHSKYQIEMHVGMMGNERRAKGGALYSYSTLAAGQYFVGEINCDDLSTVKTLLELFSPQDGSYEAELWLGKGSGRGYGKTRLWLQPLKDSYLNPLPIKSRVLDQTAITMTFLTDTILLDQWGRTISGLTNPILSSIVGMDVQIINTFISTKEINGFNAVAGLPKFCDLAVRSGSAVGFRLTESVPMKELWIILENLEKLGLGLRRREGFGRVSFNHFVYNSKILADKHTLNVLHIPELWRITDKIETVWESICIELEIYLGTLAIKDNRVRERCREVARWLYTQANLDFDDLLAQLEAFGELEILSDYGIVHRQKDNLFKDLRQKLVGRVKTANQIVKKNIDRQNLASTPDEAAIWYRKLWPLCLEWIGEKLMRDAERGEPNE